MLGDDFAVRSGAAGSTPSIGRKMHRQRTVGQRVEDWPMIRLIDGTGGGGSARTLSTSAKTHVPEVTGWQWPVANMGGGTVPVVALALGPCAGLGAARGAAASHFLRHGEGPLADLRGRPSGGQSHRQRRSHNKEDSAAGRSTAATASADIAVDSEDEAFAVARKFLSYLPSSVEELAPGVPSPTIRTAARTG